MKISRPTSVLLSALVLIGGANVAVYAANGNPFILGQTNKETTPSVLKNNGAGPALKLKADGAPLAVNNSKKIRRLNADKVDGKNAGQLGTKVWLYKVTNIGTFNNLDVEFNKLPPGRYLVTYSLKADFGTAAPHLLGCTYVGSVSLPIDVKVVTNGDQYARCMGSGIVATGTNPVFSASSADGFSVKGTAQWTFLRLNTIVKRKPGLTGVL